MKLTLRRFVLAAFALTALGVFVLADETETALGKINFAGLFDAAPAMPTNTAEAAKRALGTEMEADLVSRDLSAFYAPYDKKIAEAHAVIQPAVDAEPANHDARMQQATAEVNNNPLIARMGGSDWSWRGESDQTQQGWSENIQTPVCR